ncbi:Toxin zeta [Bienertia sinuspersici]
METLTLITTYLHSIIFFSNSNNSQCHNYSDGYGKSSLTIFLASSFGLIIAAAAFYHQRNLKHQKLVPRIKFDSSKRVVKLERFSHYVARQLGFSDRRLCPQLNKLACDYIQKREGWEDTVYSFFAHDPECDSLFIKLVEEFERCILSYFAFHWGYAETALKQVMQGPEPEPKKKLKHILLAASREKIIEKVTKDLKVARVFTTLVQEMKAIGLAQPKPEIDENESTDVMAPVAFKDRSPVLLFMGGGMGAGKSTVLKDILIEPFWQEASGQAVVIEADAFKETDLFYKALSSRGHHDAVHTAELVHQSSADAAASVLVTALNEGRDVIMDGTLSWLPFVVQTITMARNVHRKRYRMGPGYHVASDGTVTENYWEQVEDEEEDQTSKKRRPYRIELVGVVCDAYLAVIRGIRRAIICGRGVRVSSQLKSHKRFANAFPTYCQLVDQARLYCTNALEGPSKLIAELNEDADNIYELYKSPNPACQDGSIWNDIVSSPSRLNVQQELKYSIQRVEGSIDNRENRSKFQNL